MQNCFRLTTVSKILSVEKKTLRKWIATLKPLSNRNKQERVAEEFSALDLLFLEIIKGIVEIGGVNLDKIGEFSELIYSSLQKPSSNSNDEVAYILFNDTKWLIMDSPDSGTFYYCVPVGKARQKILEALGVGNTPQQHQLNFGLSLRRREIS
jgi:hypothetical protein